MNGSLDNSVSRDDLCVLPNGRKMASVYTYCMRDMSLDLAVVILVLLLWISNLSADHRNKLDEDLWALVDGKGSSAKAFRRIWKVSSCTSG